MRLAMLSFSNFGSARHPFVDKVREATRLVKKKHPELMVDGEMQADTAIFPKLRERPFPFSELDGFDVRDIVTMTAIAAVDAQKAKLAVDEEELVHELV